MQPHILVATPGRLLDLVDDASVALGGRYPPRCTTHCFAGQRMHGLGGVAPEDERHVLLSQFLSTSLLSVHVTTEGCRVALPPCTLPPCGR